MSIADPHINCQRGHPAAYPLRIAITGNPRRILSLVAYRLLAIKEHESQLLHTGFAGFSWTSWEKFKDYIRIACNFDAGVELFAYYRDHTPDGDRSFLVSNQDAFEASLACQYRRRHCAHYEIQYHQRGSAPGNNLAPGNNPAHVPLQKEALSSGKSHHDPHTAPLHNANNTIDLLSPGPEPVSPEGSINDINDPHRFPPHVATNTNSSTSQDLEGGQTIEHPQPLEGGSPRDAFQAEEPHATIAHSTRHKHSSLPPNGVLRPSRGSRPGRSTRTSPRHPSIMQTIQDSPPLSPIKPASQILEKKRTASQKTEPLRTTKTRRTTPIGNRVIGNSSRTPIRRTPGRTPVISSTQMQAAWGPQSENVGMRDSAPLLDPAHNRSSARQTSGTGEIADPYCSPASPGYNSEAENPSIAAEVYDPYSPPLQDTPSRSSRERASSSRGNSADNEAALGALDWE